VADSVTSPLESSPSSSSKSKAVKGGLYKTSFQLVPITTPTTFTDDPSRGTYEIMEDGPIEIGKIKLVRIGERIRKNQTGGGDRKAKTEADDNLVLCGWNLDGWKL
jgi:hypothetical protein